MKSGTKRVIIEIDEETFYSFKLICIKNKKTIKDVLTDMIKDFIIKEGEK